MTMKELAKQLNLSQSTISRVLNNKGSKTASPEVAKRIRDAARKYNFYPDRAAAQLRRGKSNTVGVLLPSPKNFYYAEIISNIHHTLMSNGYSPIFSFWENDLEKEKACNTILSWNIDAIITVEPQLIPDTFKKAVVSFFTEDPRFDCVMPDHFSAVRQILNYLKECGHSRICWCGSAEASRKKILDKLAPEMELDLTSCSFTEGISCVDFGAGRQIADTIVNSIEKPYPTALIAHNDNVAMGVIRRLHEHGFHVPDDFSVIGQDNLAHAQNMVPSITTVQYFVREPIGQFLVDMVLDRIKNPNTQHIVRLIDAALIVRESSGRVREKNKKAILSDRYLNGRK